MRKLLRQRSTGLWVTEIGLAADHSRAIEIASFSDALRLCARNGYREMEIVIKFPDPEDDIAVAMGDMC